MPQLKVGSFANYSNKCSILPSVVTPIAVGILNFGEMCMNGSVHSSCVVELSYAIASFLGDSIDLEGLGMCLKMALISYLFTIRYETKQLETLSTGSHGCNGQVKVTPDLLPADIWSSAAK